VEQRIAELERSVRSLRRALYAAVAAIAMLGGGAVVACKSKTKSTELVFVDGDRTMKLDAGGLHFTWGELNQATTVSASGVYAASNDPKVGDRSSTLNGGSVFTTCEGSFATLSADKLGGQLLITDTKEATAQLRAAQGYGRLHLWAKETRVEMTAQEEGGTLMLKQGSQATLSAFHDNAMLDLETGDAENRVSSLGK
jgi:hypothetical protein